MFPLVVECYNFRLEDHRLSQSQDGLRFAGVQAAALTGTASIRRMMSGSCSR
jgi:hypothetical protein